MLFWTTDSQGTVRGREYGHVRGGLYKPHISRYRVWFVEASAHTRECMPSESKAADEFCKEMNK